MKRKSRKSSVADIELSDFGIDGALEWLARAAVDAGLDANSFVRAARKAVAMAGVPASTDASRRKKLSFSQVSANTGLPRKDLPNLLDENYVNKLLVPSPVWAVALKWSESSHFTNARGVAISLEIDGGKKSFKSLVALECPDVPHTAVLKEMLRLRMVERRGTKVALLDDLKDRMRVEHDRLAATAEKARHFLRSSYLKAAERGPSELNELLILQKLPTNMLSFFLRDFSDRARSLMEAAKKWEAAYVPDSSPRDGEESVGIGVYMFREKAKEKNQSSVSASRIGKPTRRAKRA